MADSFRICKGLNSKPGAFWSQNPAFISAPDGSLFSQTVPTQPHACNIQPRLRPASLVRQLRPGKIKSRGLGQADKEHARCNPSAPFNLQVRAVWGNANDHPNFQLLSNHSFSLRNDNRSYPAHFREVETEAQRGYVLSTRSHMGWRWGYERDPQCQNLSS